MVGVERLGSVGSAVAWLRERQARLCRSVEALDDTELFRPRQANWGESKETRWLIAVMGQRDPYQDGEINRLRSLLQQIGRREYVAQQ